MPGKATVFDRVEVDEQRQVFVRLLKLDGDSRHPHRVAIVPGIPVEDQMSAVNQSLQADYSFPPLSKDDLAKILSKLEDRAREPTPLDRTTATRTIVDERVGSENKSL
jgi:hypothetical protein